MYFLKNMGKIERKESVYKKIPSSRYLFIFSLHHGLLQAAQINSQIAVHRSSEATDANVTLDPIAQWSYRHCVQWLLAPCGRYGCCYVGMPK
jgi:hypothetical protein